MTSMSGQSNHPVLAASREWRLGLPPTDSRCSEFAEVSIISDSGQVRVEDHRTC